MLKNEKEESQKQNNNTTHINSNRLDKIKKFTQLKKRNDDERRKNSNFNNDLERNLECFESKTNNKVSQVLELANEIKSIIINKSENAYDLKDTVYTKLEEIESLSELIFTYLINKNMSVISNNDNNNKSNNNSNYTSNLDEITNIIKKLEILNSTLKMIQSEKTNLIKINKKLTISSIYLKLIKILKLEIEKDQLILLNSIISSNISNGKLFCELMAFLLLNSYKNPKFKDYIIKILSNSLKDLDLNPMFFSIAFSFLIVGQTSFFKEISFDKNDKLNNLNNVTNYKFNEWISNEINTYFNRIQNKDNKIDKERGFFQNIYCLINLYKEIECLENNACIDLLNIIKTNSKLIYDIEFITSICRLNKNQIKLSDESFYSNNKDIGPYYNENDEYYKILLLINNIKQDIKYLNENRDINEFTKILTSDKIKLIKTYVTIENLNNQITKLIEKNDNFDAATYPEGNLNLNLNLNINFTFLMKLLKRDKNSDITINNNLISELIESIRDLTKMKNLFSNTHKLILNQIDIIRSNRKFLFISYEYFRKR